MTGSVSSLSQNSFQTSPKTNMGTIRALDFVLKSFDAFLKGNNIDLIESTVTQILKLFQKASEQKKYIESEISRKLLSKCSEFLTKQDFTKAKKCVKMMPLPKYRDLARLQIITKCLENVCIVQAIEVIDLIERDIEKNMALQKVVDAYLRKEDRGNAYWFTKYCIADKKTKEMEYLKIVRAYTSPALHIEKIDIDNGLKIAKEISDKILSDIAFLTLIDGAIKIDDIRRARTILSFISNVSTKLVAQVKIKNAISDKKAVLSPIHEVCI